MTGDPYGQLHYAKKIAAIVNVQGVVPSDNSPFPNLWDNYANASGRLACFEQFYDFRNMEVYVNRMNATRPGSAIYTRTNIGGGSHCCWDQFYGGHGSSPENFLLDGTSQNIYQWLAKQQRAMVSLPIDTGQIVLPRPDRSTKFFYSDGSIYLRNVGRGNLSVFDSFGRLCFYVAVNNNATLNLSTLGTGVYVAQMNTRTLKFLK